MPWATPSSLSCCSRRRSTSIRGRTEAIRAATTRAGRFGFRMIRDAAVVDGKRDRTAPGNGSTLLEAVPSLSAWRPTGRWRPIYDFDRSQQCVMPCRRAPHRAPVVQPSPAARGEPRAVIRLSDSHDGTLQRENDTARKNIGAGPGAGSNPVPPHAGALVRGRGRRRNEGFPMIDPESPPLEPAARVTPRAVSPPFARPTARPSAPSRTRAPRSAGCARG